MLDIKNIFPASIICLNDHPDNIKGQMYPEECEAIKNAISWRRREFKAGRLMAKAGLAKLGIDSFPLLNDDNRVPVWPKGIIGSITHTHNYCAVVLGKKTDHRAIGVDAEIISRIKVELWDKICTSEELAMIKTLSEIEAKRICALIFSAKESFYKCQYPLTNEFIGFQDVNIDYNLNDEIFTVTLKKDVGKLLKRGQKLTGRFFMNDDLIVTGLLL